MSKIRLGYDILSKRAIETESGVNIDEALRNIKAYLIVEKEQDHDYPSSLVEPDTKHLFLTEVGEELYKIWIWLTNPTGHWLCIAQTTSPEDSWKLWSESKGSESSSDESVYIGQNNVIDRDETYVLGQNNTVEVVDTITDFSDTDVISIGSDNSTTDGANAYQLGRENQILGNNLSDADRYPHSLAMNLGRNNRIDSWGSNSNYAGEGINIGKDNYATCFGINIGQNNSSTCVGVSVGENMKTEYNGIAIGTGKKRHYVNDLYCYYTTDSAGEYHPIGKWEEIDARGSKVDYAHFNSSTGTPEQVYRYIRVYNEETDQVRFYKQYKYTYSGGYSWYPYLTYSDSVYGYIDDNGNLVEANSAPSGKTLRTYYLFYWYEPNYSPSDSERRARTFIGTGSNSTIYLNQSDFAPSNWTTYSLSDTNQYVISNSGIISNAYIDSNENKIYTGSYEIYTKFKIWGKNVDGEFIPWFNNNFPLSECTTIVVPSSELEMRQFGYNALKDYKYWADEESIQQPLAIAKYGGKLIGSLATADAGSLVINRECSEYVNSPLENSSSWTLKNYTEYTYNGSLASTSRRVYVPKDSSITSGNLHQLDTYNLGKYLKVYGASGSAVITAMVGNSGDPAKLYTESAYGSIVIGSSMKVNSGTIAIGQNNGSIGSGTLVFGKMNELTDDTVGSTIIGNYNKKYVTSSMSGQLIIGDYNRIGSAPGVTAYSSGSIIVGNYNTCAGERDKFGNGSVTFGIYNNLKGSAGVAIGRYTNAKDASIALSYKGGFADNNSTIIGHDLFAYSNSTAIGYNVYAYSNGHVIGWNGASAFYGGFCIGYNGITAFNSMNFGWNGGSAQNGSIRIGWNGGLMNYNSIGIGFDGHNAVYGSIAIGMKDNMAEYGSMSIGFNNVKGRNGGLAVGINGTFAESGALAFGTGAFAQNGSIAVMQNDQGNYKWSFMGKKFYYYYGEDSNTRGYVDVRLGGVTTVRVNTLYDSTGNIIGYTEDPNGSSTKYKSNAGRYYGNVNEIPVTERTVEIRGHIDPDTSKVVPYFPLDVFVGDEREIPDSWVPVNWHINYNDVGVYETTTSPANINYYGATGASAVFGGKAAASGSSVAITIPMSATGFEYNETDLSNTVKQITYRLSNGINTRNNKTYQKSYLSATAIANSASIAIGRGTMATNSSFTFGSFVTADTGSLALGYGGTGGEKTYGVAKSNSLLICGIDSGSFDRGSSLNKSIAIGNAVNADNESIAIGDINKVDLNAFAIGARNTAAGWSILFGVNNTTPMTKGAHATMIGYNNESTSDLESFGVTGYRKWESKSALSQIEYEIKIKKDIILSLMRKYMSDEDYAIVANALAQENLYIEYYSFSDPELTRILGNQWNDSVLYPKFDDNEINTIRDLFDDIQEYYEEMQEAYDDYNAGIISYDEYIERYYSAYDKYNKCYTDLYSMWYDISYLQFVVDGGSYDTYYSIDAATARKYRAVIKEYEGSEYISSGLYRTVYGLWYNQKWASGDSSYDYDYYAYNLVSKEIITSSIIMGSDNQSNHYNSILVGSNNVSLAADRPFANDTSDNGFTIAAGFGNTVGRNYDMAIGYMSTANGGENLAIHKSTAIGFRNVAINYSTVSAGTSNFVVTESVLTAPGKIDDDANVISNEHAVWNFLHHSELRTDSDLGNGCSSNTMFNASVSAASTCTYFNANLICNIRKNSDNAEPIIKISCESFNENTVIGYKKYPSRVSVTEPIVFGGNGNCFTRNVLLYNGYQAFNAGGNSTNDNVVFMSELNVSANAGFENNVIGNSWIEISDSGAYLLDSVILGKSHVVFRTNSNANMSNFLFNSFMADKSLTNPYYNDVSGKYSMLNTLFNSKAYGCMSCFSYGDYDTAPFDTYGYTGPRSTETTLVDCNRLYNFGDINATSVANSFSVGLANTLTSVQRCSIIGHNNFIGLKNNDPINPISYRYTASINIIGTENKVNNYVTPAEIEAFGSYDAAVDKAFIFGYNNTIDGSYFVTDNIIMGVGNRIQGIAATVTTLTPAEAVACTTPGTYKVSGNAVYPTSDTLTSIYSSHYYLYYNGRLADSGYNYEPAEYESIAPSTLISKFNAGTLTDGTWYKPTGYTSANIPSGTFLVPGYCYTFDGTAFKKSIVALDTPYARYSMRNCIIGANNVTNNNIAGYTTIGSDNVITSNGMGDFCISNGFVQGNNNIVANGSNIITMGNGNVSTGHNSVAIGSQLISNQWQTVIGKYNAAIAGPNRLDTENPQDPTKALFIIGNGYSSKDDYNWQDEQYITRSNALEVYADGHVKAAGNIEANNIPAAPTTDGDYVLRCSVVNGVPSFSWVAVGSTTTNP